MKDFDISLYLVTDRNLLKAGRDFYDAVEESLKNGVTMLQLREKDISSKEFYEIAVRLKDIAAKYNVPFIINDRIDIALSVDADGVHLGQEDLPCSIARKILGDDKIIGISAGCVDEAVKAEKDGADYIGAGAVFYTGTKKDIGEAIGLLNLKKIKEAVNIPVVAIGGIKYSNATDVLETGVDGISVVSEIMASDDIGFATRRLRDIISK
ncbi:thiamine phosphate synthase [Thermoanaerobacterium thermosaccharolyticum]|uniref:thiamine phosphate synthase n=1 Tax=Thermoanaerobacterium thermosaccharolyticum TaxID=1517 RepID=UPI0020A3952D|nr:thiamine phosphate synthase [Thermoanaerobacterium thermosaccharolyticum]MCP2238976.1 thiamine-phosphate pyrophosphorylase [Thermoanaerobacterium thermosaccharolyticum]